MTRIVAGAARGRRLSVPPGTGTRPTSDRAREALFSALEAAVGPLGGRRLLDLYAGSGAVGLEALSRGAASVLLVERDRRALAVLRANAASLGLPGAEVRAAAVERLAGSDHPGPGFDLAFLDPPYTTSAEQVGAVLADLLAHRWLVPGAVVVVERSSHDPDLAWPPGLEAVRARRYGEATLWYGRAAERTGPPTEE